MGTGTMEEHRVSFDPSDFSSTTDLYARLTAYLNNIYVSFEILPDYDGGHEVTATIMTGWRDVTDEDREMCRRAVQSQADAKRAAELKQYNELKAKLGL